MTYRYFYQIEIEKIIFIISKFMISYIKTDSYLSQTDS